jgi:hypothetical protein
MDPVYALIAGVILGALIMLFGVALGKASKDK